MKRLGFHTLRDKATDTLGDKLSRQLQEDVAPKMSDEEAFSFAEFNLVMTFGRDYRHFILPQKADLFLRYHVLGNAIASYYHTSFKYEAVEWVEEDNEDNKHHSLDLTGYYQLSSDTIPIISDSSYWKNKRDIPLTQEEEKKYEKTIIKTTQANDTSNIQKYLKIQNA